MTPPEIEDIDKITDLVKGGKDIKQIMAVLQALDAINENDKRKKQIEEEGHANKMFLDKEFVLGKDNVYIYRDNRTKKKGYYIRIYDPKTQTHWTKSLRTTNRLQAMTMAEKIYSEKIGRITIGVRHQSITAKELVALYQNKRRRYLTDIPHEGITPKSFDALCNHIKHWEDFMKEKGHMNTNLEDIPTELGIEFGLYIKSKSKHTEGSRNNTTINHTIAAVKKMYKDIAVKEKYITANEVPIFEYLKTNREQKPTRDVLTAEEFTAVCKWINYKYCNEKGIDDKERIKRRVYGLVFTMCHYMGGRPKEILGLKWSDISINPSDDKKGKEINRQVKFSDVSNIGKALDDGWVITFPQGTTTPFKPIRRGTAHIIKTFKPIVVPIVIDGFRRSFDKKGIRIKKKDILQTMEIKKPLDIDYNNDSFESIIEKIEYAIEQHSSFLKVISKEELERYEKNNYKRKF